MGAIHFSLDMQLIHCLAENRNFQAFVETGTFKGDTVDTVRSYFNDIYSVELSDSLYKAAKERFLDDDKVTIMHGDSAQLLGRLSENLAQESVLYWLDAHWCVAENTSGDKSQCPLLKEIQCIQRLNANSVILIDDARLFMAPPLAPHDLTQWPTLHQIIEGLQSLSAEHDLMIVNDVIAFYPVEVKQAMIHYARHYGVDWLDAANCLKQHGTFLTQLEQKETFLQEQNTALLEKEAVIQGLSAELLEKEHIVHQQISLLAQNEKKYRMVNALTRIPGFWLLVSIISRLFSILRPRLGWLNQYEARSLSTSPIHKAELKHFPKLSIVTPSFGQVGFIERTMNSVLSQDYPNLEYFVQDGGSTDGTTAVLEKFGNQLSGWKSETDSGQSQAINRGFAQTSGEIMAWLNSDDLLLTGAINTVIDYFNHHPEVDVVYGNRLMVDEQDMEIGRWILPCHSDKAIAWADYIPQETLFWRRSLWDKAGGEIDESFRFAMDWDLIMRFRSAGAKFAHIPQFLGAFRIHEAQKTSALINETGMQDMTRIRKREHGYVPNRDEVRKKVMPFLLRHIITDLGYRIKTRLGFKVN